MRILLFVLAIFATLAGGAILAAADSAIHEIEAFILFVIHAVLLSGAGIVEAINLLRSEMAFLKKHTSDN